MSALLKLYPGDGPALFALSVLVQATVLLALAWLVSRLIARRNAAARYAVWLVALACVLLSPVTTWAADRAGFALIRLPRTAVAGSQLPVAGETGAAEPAVAPAPVAPSPAAVAPSLAPRPPPLHSQALTSSASASSARWRSG
jgi:hypothetical protein